MNIRTATLSHKGGREYNDDTVRVQSRDGDVCVVVGDGLGSYAGGQLASAAAADAALQEARRGSLLQESRLQTVAERAQKAVLDCQAQHRGQMKTTLVLLTLEEGRARWMHIGDSRLYRFHGGKLVNQTMDHSVSQMAVLMGEIEAGDIRHHEDRNRILRALGGENAKPEISQPLILGQEDAFLLCTDGFWEYVYENEMEETLRACAEPADWLARMEDILKKRVPPDNDNYSAAAVFC